MKFIKKILNNINKMKKRISLYLAERYLNVSWVRIKYKNRHNFWLEGDALVSKNGIKIWNEILKDNTQYMTIEKIEEYEYK